MKITGRQFTFVLFCAFLCIGLFLPVPASTGSSQAEKEDGFKIQVGVEEVRIDAVVVDRKGHQITNLTADDFEIHQDGRAQKVVSSTYIADTRVQPREKVPSQRSSGTTPGARAPALPANEIRRTIVFLVDDLSMEMTDIENARMSLQKFVDNQMQPGDLVSIMQTTGGNAGLQPFTPDKKQLLARIGKIRWKPSLSRPAALPLIMAIDYNIRALQDMPGRKFLLLLSTQVMLPDQFSRDPLFERLADQALRAGVVIHTLDIIGLVADLTIPTQKTDPRNGETMAGTLPLDAETNAAEDPELKKLRPPNAAERRTAMMAARNRNKPLPLSQKTGGLFLTNNNFFLNGIGDTEEEMKGYYLLSYIPPANTFSQDSLGQYHKIKISVKRSGSEVHTRDGFYGKPGSSREPDEKQNSLVRAMFSPFRYHDLALDLASGYIHDPQKGYVLRAWLHLDGRGLGFIKEKDGGSSVSLEAVATTSDVDGLSTDSGATQIAFPVTDDEIQWIRENGMSFSISLPAKKPGAFYIRAAVKDQASGAVGSAYQFLEIPDLKKDRLSLSSIFVLNNDDDASWIQSGFSEELRAQKDPSNRIARRSQALRRYLPGESVQFMTIVYNAKAQENSRPDLESQVALFQNGVEIFRSQPESAGIGDLRDENRILIRKTLKLEKTIQPGVCALQLQVRDRFRHEGENLATQVLDFEVISKPSDTAVPKISSVQRTPENSKNLIEMTDDELRRSYRRMLSDVKFETSHDQLQYFLQQAGDRVIAFFRDLPNISAKERVEMSKTYTDASGTPLRIFPATQSITSITRVEDYQYLILPGKDENSWVEDRVDKQNRPVKGIPDFIMSSGHAGKCGYLHPRNQPNSYFRYLGRQTKKPGAHVIAFAQKPEAAAYLAQYSETESSTPTRYLVQGFVWLDPDSYQILRMRTDMLLPERQTRLRETVTDITYGSVQTGNSRREFWLPREITVTWELPRPSGLTVVYRNHHKYSDFHSFKVDTEYEMGQPKAGR